MKRTILFLLTPALFAPLALVAQSNVAGPGSGYVFDSSSRALRPILGVPGGATLGGAIDVGGEILAAWVAPRQDLALVVTGSGTRFLRLKGGEAAPLALEGSLPAPERAAFSPSGAAVAIYAGGSIQVVSGLPNAPALAGTYAAPSGRVAARGGIQRFRSGIGSLAVSDDGRYVLFSATGGVQLRGASGESFTVAQAGMDALVAFAPGGHDAAVADPASASLMVTRDVAGAAARNALAGQAAVSGIAFSEDGKRLLVASSEAKLVTVFDLAAGTSSTAACDFSPTSLEPLGGLFRLNEVGNSPLWLLDAHGAGLQILFVPARTE
jgi:hypothetical protein